MSLGGQNQEAFMGQPSLQVIVYGPDGRMYSNPEQAKAAGVENPTFQPPANIAPAAQISPGGGYDENGKFISMSPTFQPPSMTPAAQVRPGGSYENGQFMPMPMAPEPSMMTGYGGPEGVMEPFTDAPAGGKGGAMQSRLTPLGSQPFSQPSRSFGGLNRFMPANSMSQYQTPMAMPMPQFGQGGVMDPTAMAQQAILARPMRPSFTGQPLMSREVPLGIQGNSGLAYPSMASTGLLRVPSYTSRYAGTDSGGGGGGQAASGPASTGLDTYGSYNSLSNGLVGALMGNLSQPSLSIPVDNMGTYANQPAFDFGSPMTGVGNPAESAVADAIAANNVDAGLVAALDAEAAATGAGFGGYSGDVGGFGAVGDYGNFSGNTGSYSGDVGGFGADAASGASTSVGGYSGDVGGFGADAAADASSSVGGSGSDSGGGKIVCTAMNQQYGFGSFRNAIWLRYAENNLTKAHEAGYHAIFLPLVDFAFKQGDGKLNMLTRKFLENCARHRSRDLRAEMRGTKRDTIGMIYRSVLEPLCYAVGKFKGY